MEKRGTGDTIAGVQSSPVQTAQTEIVGLFMRTTMGALIFICCYYAFFVPSSLSTSSEPLTFRYVAQDLHPTRVGDQHFSERLEEVPNGRSGCPKKVRRKLVSKGRIPKGIHGVKMMKKLTNLQEITSSSISSLEALVVHQGII